MGPTIIALPVAVTALARRWPWTGASRRWTAPGGPGPRAGARAPGPASGAGGNAPARAPGPAGGAGSRTRRTSRARGPKRLPGKQRGQVGFPGRRDPPGHRQRAFGLRFEPAARDRPAAAHQVNAGGGERDVGRESGDRTEIRREAFAETLFLRAGQRFGNHRDVGERAGARQEERRQAPAQPAGPHRTGVARQGPRVVEPERAEIRDQGAGVLLEDHRGNPGAPRPRGEARQSLATRLGSGKSEAGEERSGSGLTGGLRLERGAGDFRLRDPGTHSSTGGHGAE